MSRQLNKIDRSLTRSVRVQDMFLLSLLTVAIVATHANAQETKRGIGLGALVGQALGHDTESTLIGAAVGGGIGHIIGNEKDKKAAEAKAAQSQASAKPQTSTQTQPPAAQQPVTHDEVGPLGDTMWQLASLNPSDIAGPYASKLFNFRPDGILVTITTHADGTVVTTEEGYRVVENTLIINKPGYLINARFVDDGDQLTISAEKFSAVLKRLQSE